MERCTEEISNPSTSLRMSSYDEIAAKLLNEKFILTALELHAELCEAGTELPILKDYFGNPKNLESQNVKPEPCISIVRSSSQATLDSLDMTRYSEDGGGTDERVAILEFELRKAKENISALRANLTVITESDSTSPDKVTDKIQSIDSLIKPHERRALNFLVNEYLLRQSYKLTSITFSDENENQDFEDWEDVGLNIPKPLHLLQIYREFYRRNDYDKPPSVDASVQVDFHDLLSTDNNEICEKIETNLNDVTTEDDLGYLKQQIICLERNECDSDQDVEAIGVNKCVNRDNNIEINETMIISNATTPEKFEMVESPQQEIFITSQEADEEEDNISAVLSLADTTDTDNVEKDWMRIQLRESKMHITPTPPSSTIVNSDAEQMSELFKQQVSAYSLNSTSNNDNDTTNFSICDYDRTQESLINVLAKILPTIVPYIASNKRNDVIPLILYAIRLNPEVVQRDKLLQLLFNLKKKPQQTEREIFLKALVSLVEAKDGAIQPEEIITAYWEQSQHKYPERRLLAIDCCSALAPYTSSAIKNSLMISMLQQMLLEDKEPVVRVAVVRTLALLVASNDDHDKYFQCEELALAALDDESPQVFDVASTVLLPTLAQWALSLKRLLSHLLMRIISKLKNLLKPDIKLFSSGNDHRNNERTVRLISVLKILLPHMIVCIMNNDIVKSEINENTSFEFPQTLSRLTQSSLTNPLVFVDGDENIAQIVNKFMENTWENVSWPELEWLNNKLLPDIMMMVKMLSTSQEFVLNCVLSYLESLCYGFGNHAVQLWIKKIFQSEIVELEKHLIDLYHNGKKLNTNLTLIPAYMLMLSTVNIIELSNALKHFIVVIANSGVDITCLIITMRILLRRSDIIEQILAILWDGVVHQEAKVKSTTATLFGSIVGIIPEQIVTARIAPAIITLASDSDILVKASAVIALGKLITDCTAKEAKDKGRLTLECIVMEMNNTVITPTLSIPLISTLASIASDSPQHYVEDLIVTQLNKTSALALQQNPGVGLTIALLDAYSILVYCSLDVQCITNVLLPGLGYLQTLVNQQLPQQNENVGALIREAESRLNSMKPIETSASANSGLSLSLTATNVEKGVEDMRQRMTKIFTPKSQSRSMPSIFRKK